MRGGGAVNGTPDMFKVIEIDSMTGWEKYLDNMSGEKWTGEFTREQADACVEWRLKNITQRYRYKIVPVEPWMDDPEAVRARHAERHSTSWGMEECGEVECREACMILVREEMFRGEA